jgi:microcin C transport system substrate-binding protein
MPRDARATRLGVVFPNPPLEMLKALRGKVPQEVFTTAYWIPVAANAQAFRKHLLVATKLLSEAGLSARNMQLINIATGEPFTVEVVGCAGAAKIWPLRAAVCSSGDHGT